MYEETRRFSWTSLFIKIIIVVIFILFTIWLLSLATKNATKEVTKGMSDSLNVLTDNIYAQNMDRMKEVGRSYFTTERLPEKVGDVKTLSLAKMYEEDLILEVKDKNGNACSAKNSYVSVEKMENEYQMKVYLECGDEKETIKVIMGCYNYCDTDICERKQVKGIEYEYSKTTGGSWTAWGNWTNWSKTAVSKTNYRDVETKVVREDYSYDKTTTKSTDMGASVCPTVDGYNFKGMTNGVCNYSKIIVDTKGPNTCPQKSGDYTLVSQDGFTCKYSKSTYDTTTPSKCADTTSDGYSLTSQNGFTCNYSKTTKGTTSPNKCASTYNGYSLVSQSGFTCNYSKKSTSYTAATKTQKYTQSCSNVVVGTKTVWDCSSTCKQVIQNVTEYRCTSVPNGYTYSCSTGTLTSDNQCAVSTTVTTTTTVGCPSGYTKSGSTCVANTGTTSTKTTTVGCPSGYTKSGSTCVSSTGTTASKTTTASCPSGYEVRGTQCAKDITYKHNEDSLCDDGLRQNNGRCYKDEKVTERVNDVRNVTYYRYRLRDYTGGTTDYKWSTSDKDQSLLNAGYKLTGKTRNIGGK